MPSTLLRHTEAAAFGANCVSRTVDIRLKVRFIVSLDQHRCYGAAAVRHACLCRLARSNWNSRMKMGACLLRQSEHVTAGLKHSPHGEPLIKQVHRSATRAQQRCMQLPLRRRGLRGQRLCFVKDIKKVGSQWWSSWIRLFGKLT
jgi:hypothetical protein